MIELDRYKTITVSRDIPISPDLIKEVVDIHYTNLLKLYTENENMYLGEHDILKEPKKEKHKPDNRIVVNLAKYMVDTFEGYRLGIPIVTKHPDPVVDEYINDFERLNNINNVISETSKLTSIYGQGYFYLYQDEDKNTRITYESPKNTFVVYDDTIESKPYFAVRYKKNIDGKIVGGEVITDSEHINLALTSKGNLTFGDRVNHIFDGLPVVETVSNTERIAIFDSTKSMMNALNKALSEKANDVDYFADAYLRIHSEYPLDDEAELLLRDKRILNTHGDEVGTVEFLDKPDADSTQENLIDRLWEYIFSTANIVDLTDKNFGNSSGESYGYKMNGMDNLAKKQNTKLEDSLNEVFRLFFSIPNTKVNINDYEKIEYIFTENVPHNERIEAEIFDKYYGRISLETALSRLSFVENPEDELAKIEEEKLQRTKSMESILNNHLSDSDYYEEDR